MSSGRLNDHIEGGGSKYLDLYSFFNDFRNSTKTSSRILMIPFYALYYIIFCTRIDRAKPNDFLKNIENLVSNDRVDFFLFNSKGKSPFLLYANSGLIKLFNKVTLYLPFSIPRIYDVETIAKFNSYTNVVLFALFLYLLGNYLKQRSTKSFVILAAQLTALYISNDVFIRNNEDGLLNIDLIANIFMLSGFIHFNKYYKNVLKDLQNVLVTGFILGMLYSLKPMSLISKLFPIFIVGTWVWNVMSVYQFGKTRSNLYIVGYQIIVKSVLLLATMITFSLLVLKIFVNQSVYDENNFDFRQLSSMTQISLNSAKNLNNANVGVLKDIRFMDTVLIRHVDSLGGYLHSHDATLQTGSGGQQVTVFDQQDQMNEWIILPSNKNLRRDYLSKNNTDYEVVSKFNHILLQHKITGKFLYVHKDFRGPVSEKENAHEVTCVDFDPLSDDSHLNFEFKIEFSENKSNANLELIDNEFELISSVASHCKIISHIDKLPPWGYFQQEVICMEMAVPEKSKFVVEKIVASTPESISKLEYRFLDNLPFMSIMKDYQDKSIKKEIYDDDFTAKLNSHKNTGNVISNKEAIFKFTQLKYLHLAFVVVVILTAVITLVLASKLLPFRGNVVTTKVLLDMKTSSYRQLCDFVPFVAGIVIYSFLLIKTKETIFIGDLSFQSVVTLELLVVFEFINSLF
ncbi:hypothetical protein FOG51_01703 [Hanseniaspora uvarum]|uniref:Dolichyl-phosphate-mannose--protein mannosyltransferase 5 n=1 Tax=Hanseniaspora uvarum TaxID=29833 RepID=A0A1E5RZ10_HANUV|nr:hypothetical protein FOG51_01703 [Hanseniaspora uvarum]KAF0278939.1 hypothetical protein FOG50_00218 [Hanseniaspora uvarum]OEJ92066.1 Dolichyl-phosphate-mannose--protein mannosyltransferase 5 [Hanseniaspora uvarum]